MRLELNDNAYWLGFWAVAFTTLVLVVHFLVDANVDKTSMYVQNGYTMKTLPGAAYPEWTLPEKPKEAK